MLKEKEIPLGTELVNIFGVNDQNLNFLKSQFPNSKINLRGNIVYLEGSKEDIQNATSIIDELLSMSSQNKKIDVEDLELMLNFQTNKESLDQKNNYINVYQDKIIKLKNLSQFKYIENINKSVVTFGIGPAGTGKTFLAVASAVKLYDEEKVKKIVLTRPAVEAGERLGYLPGDLSQKIDPYLVPLFDSLEYFFGNENLQYLIEKRVIEIVPLAYMRGRTLSNACIILDEAQNATVSQIKMFLTRIGDESKIIITGDESQVDLQNKEFSGLKKVRKSLSNIEEISISLFENKDIVRNKIVSKILEVFPEK